MCKLFVVVQNGTAHCKQRATWAARTAARAAGRSDRPDHLGQLRSYSALCSGSACKARGPQRDARGERGLEWGMVHQQLCSCHACSQSTNTRRSLGSKLLVMMHEKS
jgi:hypothetical protein